MKMRRSFPFEIQQLNDIWIPMADGAQLAGRVWLPNGAEKAPVPAILEYIPYRHSDNTALKDSMMHPYFAGHGYASVRVDLRGSGNSDGVLEDEYLPQEQVDALEVLRWLAAQPWCDGSVGMMGISWGGFNALQVAALNPPELKAIITVCSTDDRYADDVHHMGGCLLGDNLSWASIMFAHNSMPPDPLVVGERWREMWFERLQGSGLWLEKWLSHQRRDDYWAHGSVSENYDAITCPVYAVSGWADGYSNAVFRLLENLHVPRKGLVGPWSHKYPHLGKPGPAIGFLQEALRWWDHWLKGWDTGIMDEPQLRAWMLESMPPTPKFPYGERPGRWVTEPTWPASNSRPMRCPLYAGGIALDEEQTLDETMLTVQSPLTLGLFAGKWCSYAETPDLPQDQRLEDGGALVFDSPPLEEGLEILGAPEVALDVASSQPLSMVAVRLSDVAPDDKVTRVTYGLLNLTHRNSREDPESLEPGERYRVCVPLNHVAQGFPPGHRLRLSISTSYWPLAWPPPKPVRLAVHTGASALTLPVRPQSSGDAEFRRFEEPEVAEPIATTLMEPPHHNWWVLWDLARDQATLEVMADEGTLMLNDSSLEYTTKQQEWYASQGDDFLSLRGETQGVRELKRGEWAVRTETRTILTCNAEEFQVHAQLDAYEGPKRVFSRNWDSTIPRDYI
ncbi:MAG: CocE/NonD family hydrolase [Dehalococcoidia bacterium]